MGSRGASSGYKASKKQALPKLTGTEKQIAWAESIRQDLYDYLSEVEKAVRNKDKDIWIAVKYKGKEVKGMENREELYIRTDERGKDGKRIKKDLTLSDIGHAVEEVNKIFNTEKGKKAGWIIDNRDILNGQEIMDRIRRRKRTDAPIFKKSIYRDI